MEIGLPAVRRAVELDPQQPWFRYNLAFTLFESGQNVEALETFRAAEKQFPKLEVTRAYIVRRAMATYAVYKEHPGVVNDDELKASLKRVLDNGGPAKAKMATLFAEAMAAMKMTYEVAQSEKQA